MQLSGVMFIIMPTVLAMMIWLTGLGESVHFMLHLVGNRLVGRFVLLKNPPMLSEFVVYMEVAGEMPCLKNVIEFSFTCFPWEVATLKANIHT